MFFIARKENNNNKQDSNNNKRERKIETTRERGIAATIAKEQGTIRTTTREV